MPQGSRVGRSEKPGVSAASRNLTAAGHLRFSKVKRLSAPPPMPGAGSLQEGPSSSGAEGPWVPALGFKHGLHPSPAG